MIDSQTSDADLAMEVGFRVAKTGTDSYQFQRVDGRGITTSVAPTQKHTYELWQHFVRVARQLGAAIEGGKAGDGVEPSKSESPRLA